MLLSALLTSTGKNRAISTHEMEIRIPESGKVLLMESGLQLKESGIPLTIGILESKFCGQRLESSSWNPLHGAIPQTSELQNRKHF